MELINALETCSYPLWVNVTETDYSENYETAREAIRDLWSHRTRPVYYITVNGEGELTIEI